MNWRSSSATMTADGFRYLTAGVESISRFRKALRTAISILLWFHATTWPLRRITLVATMIGCGMFDSPTRHLAYSFDWRRTTTLLGHVVLVRLDQRPLDDLVNLVRRSWCASARPPWRDARFSSSAHRQGDALHKAADFHS